MKKEKQKEMEKRVIQEYLKEEEKVAGEYLMCFRRRRWS